MGSIPTVEQRHLSLLGAVSLALFFEEYDLAMLTAALPQIATELSMAETDFGLYLGIIRLGALPAFAIIPFADRIGRRRVFLASLLLTSTTTVLTAFSQNGLQFVVLQMLTRTFFITGSAVAFVIIAEEFPAKHRGWGIGMLGALGVSGHGLAMALFSQIERLPYGWRALYAAGAAPVLLFPYVRRRTPETARYRAHEASRDGEASESYAWRPLFDLALRSPVRALGIAVAGFVPAIGLMCAFQFTGYFTQTVHGWSPGQYAAMVVFGGAVGILGNVAAGHLGDRFGRRVIGFLLLGSFPFWTALFYNGPSWSIPLAWVGLLFGAQGGRAILRALSTELFATSERASAVGMFSILEAAGAALGLFLLYFGSLEAGDFIGLTTLLAFAVLLGGCVVVLFPETRQRELEAISHGSGG